MPVSRFYFNNQSCSDCQSLIPKYGKLAFASPKRSTVPLLALLKGHPELFDRALSQCIPAVAGAELHLEFKVRSLRGNGKASHTDVMVIVPSCAVAVETKWTEPRGATVGSIDDLSRNKREVLEGWLDLLRPRAIKPLHTRDVVGIVYQKLHRAASACFSERDPGLVYIQFQSASATQKHPDHRFTDLTQLHRVLGSPVKFPFFLIDVPIAGTKDFEKIEKLKKGTTDTDDSVRAALVADGLFDFGEPVIRRVGEAV